MTTTNGFHAADDGSLARTTGGAAARGAMLIALAIIIGIVLLTFALSDPETQIASTDGDAAAATDEADATAGETEAEAAAAAAAAAVAAADAGDGSATGSIDNGAEADAAVIPEETIDASGVARAPSEVNVVVANGVGTSGIAGAAAGTLIADGYIGVAADAPSTSASVIFYREGFDADAREVAAVLGTTPDIIQPVPADGSVPIKQNAIDDGRAAAANVVVIIGTDGVIPTS